MDASKKQKKDEITLTKKTSLLVALFNKAMLKASTKRENYWGQSLNGNNVNKFLKNIDNNFSTFKESLTVNYPDFPLHDHCNKFRELFHSFKKVYDSVNHGRVVSEADCDAAQSHIDQYMTLVHSFGWKTLPNKMHYLEERCVPRMREKKVGLSIHGDQGMEAANQSRKKSVKRTKCMNNLKGMLSDGKRLCEDKHMIKGKKDDE